jgi:hypothetical protein
MTLPGVGDQRREAQNEKTALGGIFSKGKGSQTEAGEALEIFGPFLHEFSMAQQKNA